MGVPIIGCGCAVCRSTDTRDRRLRTSALFTVDGRRLLIDAGPDFRYQMLRAAVTHIDGIMLTHEHADHIFGLDDIRAFNWMQGPVNLYAEERVLQNLRRVYDYAFIPAPYPGSPKLALHSIDMQPFDVAGISVIPVRGWHHRLPVLGFRIGNAAYLTDVKTVAVAEQQKLLGLDILIVNALRHTSHHSHFNLEEALQLINTVKPRHAWLTHISHDMGLYAETCQNLPENVSIAYDGLIIENT